MADSRDLATLDDAKQYASSSLPGTSLSDQVLAGILTGVSSAIAEYLQMRLDAQAYIEVRNGTGQDSLWAQRRPIIAVAVLAIFGVAVPLGSQGEAGASLAAGYVYDRNAVYLVGTPAIGRAPSNYGCGFARGPRNVQMTYTAGYVTPGQLALLGAPVWAGNTTYGPGAQLAPIGGLVFSTRQGGKSGVSAPAWPTQLGASVADGQITWQASGYFPSMTGAGGMETAATPTTLGAAAYAALIGANGLPLNAPLLPPQIVTAALMQIAYVFRMRTNIGVSSTGEGPQRITFSQRDMHPTVRDMLEDFRSVVAPGDAF